MKKHLTRTEARAQFAAIVKSAGKGKEISFGGTSKAPEVMVSGPKKGVALDQRMTQEHIRSNWAAVVESVKFGSAKVGIVDDNKILALIQPHPNRKPMMITSKPAEKGTQRKLNKLDSIADGVSEALSLVKELSKELQDVVSKLEASEEKIHRNFRDQWRKMEEFRSFLSTQSNR